MQLRATLWAPALLATGLLCACNKPTPQATGDNPPPPAAAPDMQQQQAAPPGSNQQPATPPASNQPAPDQTQPAPPPR